MKKNVNVLLSAVLACGMVFGSAPGLAVHAAASGELPVLESTGERKTREAADDTIVKENGKETLRYLTGQEKTFSAPESYNNHVQDFFKGAKTVSFSVDYKTTNTGLQALMSLSEGSSSAQYLAMYTAGNQIGVELRGGVDLRGNATVTDGEWHTYEVRIVEGQGYYLYADQSLVASKEDGNATVSIAKMSWTPGNFALGGIVRNGTSWNFSGSLRNVVCEREVEAEIQAPVSESRYMYLDGQNGLSKGEQEAKKLTALTNGSLHFVYRLGEGAENAACALLSVKNAQKEAVVYVDAAKGTAGICSNGQKAEATIANTKLSGTKWHTLTITFDGAKAIFYADGTRAGEAALTDAFSAIDAATDLVIGAADSSDYQALKGGMDAFQVYNGVLTDGQIKTLHAATSSAQFPDGTMQGGDIRKNENIGIFTNGYAGSAFYRIPAVITTMKGTVIASSDQRIYNVGDVGVIHSVIRRSTDNGLSFAEPIRVIELMENEGYTVDPALVQDTDPNSPTYGRIFMLVDMFPSGIGFAAANAGTGYVTVDGKKYLKLTDSSKNEYTVREDGVVFDAAGEKTDYQVEMQAGAPFTTQGKMYRNGSYVGNIYKNAPLKIDSTCYLWLTYSDDDGLTWSTPQDLNPQIKESWMKFCGTGPGIGIQLQSGRLMFPIYFTNGNSIQSSANIYSDDHGKTWKRGESPNDTATESAETTSGRHLTESVIVELDNGHLIQFMRSYSNLTYAISTDQGETWEDPQIYSQIAEPYCQLSVVHYPTKIKDPKDGKEKEAIIFSNPNAGGRSNGTVRIGFVNEDDTIDWAYSRVITADKYAYSSLTVMEDGNIGLIYETTNDNIAFTSFSPAWIMNGSTYEKTPECTAITSEVTAKEEGKLQTGDTIAIKTVFDQNVFVAGQLSLNLYIGDQVKKAVFDHKENDQTLVFTYELQPEDAGVIVAKPEINIENGYAESIYNMPLTDIPVATRTVNVGDAADSAASPILPTEGMQATAGSAHAGTNEGPASNVLDGSNDTWWHSSYPTDNTSNGGRSKHYVTIALGKNYYVDGVTYTPRQGNNNGSITKYQIEVSSDGTNFVPVAIGSWKKNSDVKIGKIKAAVPATHVRLRVLDTGDEWASACEIRITGKELPAGQVADKTALLNSLMTISDYTAYAGDTKEWEAFTKAMKDADSALANESISDAELASVNERLQQSLQALVPVLKTELQQMTEEGSQLKEEDYTISSWYDYCSAVEAAKALNDQASVSEVMDAYSNLKDVRHAMTMKPGVAASAKEIQQLNDQIAAAKAYQASDYTEDSYAALTKATVQAEKLLKAGAVSNEMLQKAMEELKQAVAGLVKKTPDATGEKPGDKPGQTEQKPQKLEAPQIQSVKSSAGKQAVTVQITVNPVKNAGAYSVYRVIGTAKTKIGTIEAGKNTIVDQNPVSGKKAGYYAVAESSDSKYLTSADGAVKTITMAKNTTKVTGKQKGKAVRVSWKKVKGAKGYYVYRSEKKSTGYRRVGRLTKKNQYTDKKVKAGKKYYYKIATKGKAAYSAMSKPSKVVKMKK